MPKNLRRALLSEALQCSLLAAGILGLPREVFSQALANNSKTVAEPDWPIANPVTARAWILVDLTTGQSLAGQEDSRPLEPGGLTSMMTAYLALAALRDRQLRMQQVIPGPDPASVPAGPKMFLPPTGATVKELLVGVFLIGALDAAIALANAIAGGEEQFVALMNETARRLGMESTRFVNATGTPGALGASGAGSTARPVTTARDLALLGLRTYQEFPDVLQITTQREFVANGIRQTNRNRLLWLDRSVDGFLATDQSLASSCLVTARRPQPLGPKEQIQRRIMLVLLESKSIEARAQETLELLNFGFQQFDLVRLFRQDALPASIEVFKGVRPKVKTEFRQDVMVAAPRRQIPLLRAEMETAQGLVAPVTAGQAVGALRISLGNLAIHRVDLVAAESIESAGLLGRAIDSLRLIVKTLP